jgi:hypothetical protein
MIVKVICLVGRPFSAFFKLDLHRITLSFTNVTGFRAGRAGLGLARLMQGD